MDNAPAQTATTADTGPLFKPFESEKLQLRNRVVMAPMGRHFAVDGLPDPAYADYYGRRAEGGAALIITEAVRIPHLTAAKAFNDSRFHEDDALSVWAEVVRRVHAGGAKFAPQLWHAGLLRNPNKSPPNPHIPPTGPSGLLHPDLGVYEEGVKVCEPATEQEIETVIAAFGEAAASAVRIGCDAIEIHGAHGYLIDQFLWPVSNLRLDRWGGSLENRSRLAIEVTKECRRQVGPDFPILFRFSQWKQQDYENRLFTTPQELEAFLGPLVDAGVDIFDVSTRRYWPSEFANSDLTLAGWTKKLSGRPSIAVGSVGLGVAYQRVGNNPSGAASLDPLIAMMERDEFDLVAVGRAMIANPNWANDVKARRWDRLEPYSRDLLATLA